MNIVESLQNLENKLFEEKDEYHDLVGALLQKPNAKSMIMEMIENNDIEGIIKCLEEDYVVEDADDYDEWTDDDNDIYNRWAFVKSKSVKDIDGFYTDYSMWQEVEDGAATEHFVFIFGDSDLYNPENSDFDWECDSKEEAEEWFDNYSGFEEDDEYEDWHDTADQEQVDQPDYVPERVEDELISESKDSSTITWPNGMPVSDLDLFKALRYNFGTDVVKKESDINDYTDDEKQRSVNYYAQSNLDESLKESEGLTKDERVGQKYQNENGTIIQITDPQKNGRPQWNTIRDGKIIDCKDTDSYETLDKILNDNGYKLVESALGEDKIYIHKGDVQFNDGSTKFYELKTIAPSDLKARNNFRYQVCIDMFQDVNPFNLSRIYIPFDNISEFTLEEVPEEEIEKIDDGVQLSMFDKVEEI